MFERLEQQSWLRFQLPTVVRFGLENPNNSDDFFPNGITESLEPFDMVATGQQPGFLGGPLYSLYKRWTAQIISQTNSPHFWIEGGDSDWEEISKIHWQSQIISFDDELSGVPTTQRSIPSDLFDKLLSTLHSESQQDALHSFRDAFYCTVVTSFIKFHELAGKPVLHTNWFEGPPNLEERLDTLYRTLLSDWFLELPKALHCLRTGIERTRSQFQTVQAELLENRTGWFYQHQPGEKRIPILTNGTTFQIGENNFEREDLAQFVNETKGNFIPGALWRTVVQQALCTPSNVVVGISEAAYWSETADLFRWAGLQFPRLTLRIGITLLPKRFSQLNKDEILGNSPPVYTQPMHWQKLQSLFYEMNAELSHSIRDFPEHLQQSIQKSMEKMSYQYQKIVETSDRYYDEKSGSKKKLWQIANQEIGVTSIPQERKMTLLEAYLQWGNSLNYIYEILQKEAVGGRYIFLDRS